METILRINLGLDLRNRRSLHFESRTNQGIRHNNSYRYDILVISYLFFLQIRIFKFTHFPYQIIRKSYAAAPLCSVSVCGRVDAKWHTSITVISTKKTHDPEHHFENLCSPFNSHLDKNAWLKKYWFNIYICIYPQHTNDIKFCSYVLYCSEHAKELGNAIPSEPILFLKPTSSYITKGQQIVVRERKATMLLLFKKEILIDMFDTCSIKHIVSSVVSSSPTYYGTCSTSLLQVGYQLLKSFIVWSEIFWVWVWFRPLKLV